MGALCTLNIGWCVIEMCNMRCAVLPLVISFVSYKL
jgi:hypothetical protein